MTTYYTSQLSRLNPSEPIRIQLAGTESTNWLNLNLDSIEAIEALLTKVKAARIKAITPLIPVKSITIHYAEGKNCELYPQTFKSFNEVNNMLMFTSYQFPENGGYDKHNFTVIWDDDSKTEFKGRLDCKHNACINNDLDMAKHIRDWLNHLINSGDSQTDEARNLLNNFQF